MASMLELNEDEIERLREAKLLLESPGIIARLANAVGAPIERGFEMLPDGWRDTVQRAVQKAMEQALRAATHSIDGRAPIRSSNGWHKLLVGASGGVGGAFGLAALPIELPVSTTLMLRSIADVARSEGFDVHELETRMSCLEVFALGGPRQEDDAVENAYWAVRAALGKAVTEATRFVASRGLAEESAPAIVRLIHAIAGRFGALVSHQVAAKAVPVVGAVAGSSLNILFMDHYQKMARGHFMVRKLEAKYGSEMVRQAYENIAIRI